jgi:hypothetical protein
MNGLNAAVAVLAILFLIAGPVQDTRLSPGEAAPRAVALAAWPAPTANVPSEALTGLVRQYCVACHNDAAMTGNLSLQGFDVEAAPEMAETAEKMIRKLRAGMMPPRGMPRPGGDSLQLLVRTLEETIDRAAELSPDPGTRVFQRLNRAEYASSIRDLLGIDVDVSEFLPLDTKSANFDNIADVQMPSATVMEGYLRAAAHISRAALGDPDAEPNSVGYRVPRTASQKDRVPGAPFGTRGGLSVVHNFPADGKYVFQIQPYPAVEGEVFGRTFGNEQIEVSIDGERVALVALDRWVTEAEPGGLNLYTDSIYVRAGARRVTAAFLKVFEGEIDDLIRPIDHTLADGQIGIGYGVTTLPHLQRLTILGPYEITGVSDTPSRQRVFTCRPTAPSEARGCAERIVERLATRAYRRPLRAGDLDGLMSFYDVGVSRGGFEAGVRTALQAILASPHFLFRMEGAGGASPGEIYRVGDADLAARLSFFLWGAPPDATLVELAGRGALSEPAELERQTRRMLADPRAPDALATRFASQWMRLQDLEKIHPDALTYPYFDETLAKSMLRETELLFAELVARDRPLTELLTADYTFVDERLARHYGFPGVTGPAFRRIQYPDERRRGILGHGSVLTMTSHADRTSPVLRGKWVLEVLLGTPPPPPPPDVPAFEETVEADAGRRLTVRERMEEHRQNPACMSCHVVIDPLGLALENFDVTGAWRVRDEGNFVDPVGEMYDGTTLAGPADLREALLTRPEVFYRVFTENLMAYALGRRVEHFDMPAVRRIVGQAAGNDFRLSSFVLGIVTSPAFQSTRAGVLAADAADGG